MEKLAPSSPADGKLSMSVDFVIIYRFYKEDKTNAVQRFSKLTEALSKAGLITTVRNGVDFGSVFLFVKAPVDNQLFEEVYRSRIKDWLHGVRSSAPDKDVNKELEERPLEEAERLRIVYQLITHSPDAGGAGITPKVGEWENVDAVFALHDHEHNKKWIKEMSTKYLLSIEDLDSIRDRLGEKIGFYFAFTQSYATFLVFPAVFGLTCRYLLSEFSPIYAIINGLWCIAFTEYWKHQEHDLAVRWGVKGVSSIQSKRKEFKKDKMIEDPITGEKMEFFPATKRFQRQLLQLPFTIAAVAILGSLIATCFGIEIFISEVYDGPFKGILVFLPTIILSTAMPVLTTNLTNFARSLTAFENYETDAAFETAFTQKIFVLNFVTSYLPIILTAFVYLPFGSLIVPYLDVFSLTVKPFAKNENQLKTPTSSEFEINPGRLTKQVIYFTVTAQIVNMATEIVVPYIKRQGMSKYKEMKDKKSEAGPQVSDNDSPEEASFLARVRSEAGLEVYDVTSDFREMVVQFGYLSLFSVVWPLTAVSFVINDWLELRADAIKICVEMQRPLPRRADTIGPWLDGLTFLAWLGSITTAALVYMFGNGQGPDGTPKGIAGWALLLSIFFSEHLYLVARWVVRVGLSRLDSPGRQAERREKYRVRNQIFKETFGELGERKVIEQPEEKITHASLEEDARASTLKSSNPSDKFWARQRGWRETAQVGERLIQSALVSAESKESKKSQ